MGHAICTLKDIDEELRDILQQIQNKNEELKLKHQNQYNDMLFVQTSKTNTQQQQKKT